ncbi:bidirectional sugar transporter SWEET4-like isoform X1 [Macadamia integrifolia]|uniref:bidirectional sugar transporter SWEET4-like isoform X1 n=2 Tax=Macadamia integrifolia TaxID=60698 RepID=UPI001C4F03D5|nr:bidirectional sugar transporter SWEET4-like isoform X1 [Macadamia integrifolia]
MVLCCTILFDAISPILLHHKLLLPIMVSAEVARTTVGILGNITSLILFLSPLPTFIQIWKKGSVEQFSPAPYLATLLNCMIWLVYGLPLVHPHSMLLITINGSGCLIELTFVLLFLFYSDGRKRFRVLVMLMLEFAFVASVAILVLTLSHTISRRSLVVGSVCVFFGTLMYAAPLAVLKLVITTRSIEYMPFFLSLASFVNSICWTAYAVIRFDLFITIPNSLGILFGLVQLILYGKFYKSTQRQIEARKRQGKGDMGLPEVVLIQDSKKMIINNPTQQNGYLVSETPGQP